VKVIPIALQAHYDGDSLTTAEAIKLTRMDGAVFAYTTHDVEATIDGTTYQASGIAGSTFESSPDLAVDNLTLTTLDDGSLFTRADVIGGLWQNAEYFIFRYNWAAPDDGIEPISAGTLGEVSILTGKVTVELRGLQQYLQQPVGEITSKTCRARLGDARCTVDLSGFTHAGTVTTAGSSQVFTASALTQAEDYFGEGLVEWLTGDNAGLEQKVRVHATGGVFTLVLAMPQPIQVGDTFTAIAGCRKRMDEDCATKFSNALNFQGEPHIPGIDALTSLPEVDA
jgi:uncharacterized phage protein (TIGR02218 family)